MIPSPTHPGPVVPVELPEDLREPEPTADDPALAALEQRVMILEHQVQELLAMIEDREP